MVYESDYSTRRVYSSSSPRPGITSSYSYTTSPVFGPQQNIPIMPYASPIYIPTNDLVSPYAVAPVQLVSPILYPHHHHRQHTVLAFAPGIGKGRTYNRIIPYIAHQRLVAVSPPPQALRLRNLYSQLEDGRGGAFGGGLNYVLVHVGVNQPPPLPARRLPLSKITYIEDITNSSELEDYTRQTRGIRRDADNLLMRLGLGLQAPLYSLHTVPLRSASDLKEAVDIRRRYVHERNNPHIPYSQIKNDVYRMAMYQEPERYPLRGPGNLACLSFAGGRPIPKRRRFYPINEDKIREDINFRSFYLKIKDAASYGKEYVKQLYQPMYRSQKSILRLGDEEKKDRKEAESKWVSLALSKPDAPPSPKRLAAEAKRIKEEALKPKPKTVAPRQDVDITLPGPKSTIEVPERKPSVINVPEEEIVVKYPRSVQEEIPKVEAKTEKTVRVPSTPTKPERSAKVPEPEPEPPAKDPEPEPEPPTKVPDPEPPTKVPDPEPPAKVSEPEPEPEPPAPTPEPVQIAPVEETPTIAEAPREVKAEEPPTEVAQSGLVETSEPTEAPAETPTDTAVKSTPSAEEVVVVSGIADIESAPEQNAPSVGATVTPEEPAESTPQEVPVAEVPSPEPVKEAEPAAVVEELSAASEPVPPSEGAHAGTDEEASNKGEDIDDGIIEDDIEVQINEEVTLDEVCDVQIEENDLEIDSPVESEGAELPQDEEPIIEEETPAPEVSNVVADINGTPLEEQQPSTDTKEQDDEPDALHSIEDKGDAERRRSEFGRLLEEHAEIVETVQLLEMEEQQEAATEIELN